MSFHLLNTTQDCPPAQVIGTRAAILGLSGSYNTKCHYIVTDYADGNRLNGVSILLHAVDADSLSKNVSVLTPYDSEAWVGEYTIASNEITKLQDRIGNVVHGPQAVQRFDWGNIRFSDNKILDNAVLLTTIGQTGYFMTHCTFAEGVSVDLQGKPLGNIANCRFHGGGSVTISGPLNLLSSTFVACSANFDATVGGSLTRCTINGLVNCQIRNATLNWADTTIDNSFGQFRLEGSTVCTWSMNSCSLSAVQIGSTNLTPVPSSIQMVTVEMKGSLLQFSSAVGTIGTLVILDSVIEDTTIQQNTGSITISASNINAGVIQQLGGQSPLNLLSCNIWNSNVALLAGHASSAQVQLQGCTLEKSAVLITKPDGVVTLSATNLRLDSQIFDDTNGTLTWSSSELDGASWSFSGATHPGYTFSVCRYRRLSATVINCTGQLQVSFENVFNTAIAFTNNVAVLNLSLNQSQGGSIQILNTVAGTLQLLNSRLFETNISINGGVPVLQRYEATFTNISLNGNTQTSNNVVIVGGSLAQGIFSLNNAWLPNGIYTLVANTANAHRPLATAYPTII